MVAVLRLLKGSPVIVGVLVQEVAPSSSLSRVGFIDDRISILVLEGPIVMVIINGVLDLVNHGGET